MLRLAAAASLSFCTVAGFTFAGCASPSTMPGTSGTSTANGPAASTSFLGGSSPDLAVSHVHADMGTAVDLSESVDLSHASSPDFAVSSNCGSVTSSGECNGNTLTKCTSGSLVTTDCTQSNKTCQVSSSGTASCKTASTTTGCGSVDSSGECSGNTLKYCDTSTNTLVTQNCTSSGTTCQYDFTFDYYDCE